MDEFASALSGGLAGAISSFLTYPLDTILVRYQSKYNEKPKYTNSFSCNKIINSNTQINSNENRQSNTQQLGLNTCVNNERCSSNIFNNHNSINEQHTKKINEEKKVIGGEKRKISCVSISSGNYESNNNSDVNIFNEIYKINKLNNNKNYSYCVNSKINHNKSYEHSQVPSEANMHYFSSIFVDKKKNNNFVEICKMYNGVTFKMFESLMKNFVFFYWHIALKKAYEKKFGRITPYANIFLAAVAGVLSLAVTAPMEVITTNLQTSQLTLKTIVHSIFLKEGLIGFYRGFVASVILCTNPAITNATFDYLKMLIQLLKSDNLKYRLLGGEDFDQEEFLSHFDQRLPALSALQSFFLGAISKTIATVVTYPYIRTKVFVQARVLKSRQQIAEKKRSEDTDMNTILNTNEEKTADVYIQNNKIDLNNFYERFEYYENLERLDTNNFLSRNYPSPSSFLSTSEMLKAASFCLSDFNEAMSCTNDEGHQLSFSINKFNPPICRNDSIFSESDKGIIGVVVSTVMQEGVYGLYSGLKLQLLKTVIASAILYMIKEKLYTLTKHFLRLLIFVFLKKKRIRNLSQHRM